MNSISRNSLAYFNRVLAPGIVQHRFHRVPNWDAQFGPSTPEHVVLLVMKNDGVYSLISFEKSHTSLIGPAEGLVHPKDIIQNQRGPALFVTGGFFLHFPSYFKPPGGEPLHNEFFNWTVGETSLTQNSVPFDPAYADVMKKRVMSDGSFYTTGPSLNEELDLSMPHFTRVNSPAGRYHYLAYDDTGHPIPNPIWKDLQSFDRTYNDILKSKAYHSMGGGPSLAIELECLRQTGRVVKKQRDGSVKFAAVRPAHTHIRTSWAFAPTNLSHATQPNERSGISRHPTGILLSHVYNSLREHGLTLNEFRSLMKAGSEYLNLPFEDIHPDEVWANDGGGSIFQIFVDGHGKPGLLASGGQVTQECELDLEAASLRLIPHAVRVTLSCE